ncbi:MAG: hypothetical protein HAW63_04835 [Bdellovibrionaceae bacterium]|nr:hypothetical protein [Pseudobdellovibrionaceae bacterium]
MIDFNQLHKIANELEEFSSKALSKTPSIKPKAISSGTLLYSTTEPEFSFSNQEFIHFPKNSQKKVKKNWPSSPSVEFFSSPGVIQAEKKELKQVQLEKKQPLNTIDYSISIDNLNAHTLLNSMDNFSSLKTEEEADSKKNNNFHSAQANTLECNQTLKNIGFISIEDRQEEYKKNKKETLSVQSPINQQLNTNKIIQPQAFTYLYNEVSFGFSAFILDLLFNFSVFALINFMYKMLFSGNLLQFSTLKFLFIFSLIFQVSTFIQRVIFKKTFGEWYTNVQIGTDKQQFDILYSLSLFWRSFMTLCTGVVIFPVLSFFINKDLMYYLTDLQTFKKNNN